MERIKRFKKWILLSLMVVFATMMAVSGEAAFTAARTGVNYPISLRVGQTFSIKGTVTANEKIAKAVVTIYDGDGKNCLQRFTAYPNSKTFDIADADMAMEFNRLSKGEYYYRVSVFNAEGYKVSVVNRLFTVGDESRKPRLTLDGVVPPTTLKAGSDFALVGTINANFIMKSVVCTIYDSTGNTCLQRYSAKVNANSYNLKKSDSYLSFNKLTPGTYYYRVCAYDQSNTKYRAVNKKFTVIAGSTITIKNPSPAANVTIKQGSSLSLGGTITSTYNLAVVKGVILDSAGQVVYTKSVKPKTKTYKLANSAIDKALYFEKLAAGTYTLKVSAKDSQGTIKTLIKRKVTVKKVAPDPAPIADMQISYPVPDSDITIYEGSTYSLGGIITSKHTLKQVTITLSKADGKIVTRKSVDPNSKIYVLNNSTLDAAIEFETLTRGSYVLKLTAKNIYDESKVLMDRKILVK